jgi:cobalt-zinc-cadmium efflux system outer membrane protein
MFWIRSVALACATLAAVAPAHAQSSAQLDFPTAARKTLAAEPHLRRLSIELDVARTREDTAALRAPLEVGAEFENVAGSGATKGIDAAEITLSISSLLERGGKRNARIQEAQRFIELLSIEQRIALLDALGETGRRFVAVAVAQEVRELARRRVAQAKQTLDLIAARVAAARSPRTEQLNAEIELSAAEMALTQSDRELEAAQLSLAAQWASPVERPVVTADLTAMAEPRAFELLSQQLTNLPDLDRFAAESRLREAELRLAQSQAVADWRWSAGVRRLEEINEQALVLGFSMPIGVSRRNAAAIRAAELQQKATVIDSHARRLELLALLHSHWQQLQSSRTAAAAIRDSQLPRAQEALELTKRGYEIGRFPYRELAIAQQQVLSLEALRLEASARFHLTRIEIERLTGAQLSLLEGNTP